MIKSGLLLTAESQDIDKQLILRFYGINEEGSFVLTFTQEKAVFFLPADAAINLDHYEVYEKSRLNLLSFSNHPVDALYFRSLKSYLDCKKGLEEQKILSFENDVWPEDRFLMERFIRGLVDFKGEGKKQGGVIEYVNPQIKSSAQELFPLVASAKILSLDIETGQNNELYSIALHGTSYDGKMNPLTTVLMLGEKQQDASEDDLKHFNLHYFTKESELLRHFVHLFHQFDPDFIIGWHVIGFDLHFLKNKAQALNIDFNLGRHKGPLTITERKGSGYFADIRGRIILDGPPILRGAFYRFDNYKLETVAQTLLGRGKDIGESEDKVQEIEDRFRYDKLALARYNFLDAKLVTDIFKHTNIIDHYLKRSLMSGLLLDRIHSSTKAFDHYYLPRLHRRGYVASNISDIGRISEAPGGLVLDTKTGLYEHIIVLDFKSFYPSIIQCFNIDPLSRLLNEKNTLSLPNGLQFSRNESILPSFIAELKRKRKEASGHDENLSLAIKILMNSFYGVMGSSSSRFYHADLARSITETGHFILKMTVEFIEEQKLQVIYGDTDSLFVKLNPLDRFHAEEKAQMLAKEINIFLAKELARRFKVESFLDIKFEKYFPLFFIPGTRPSLSDASEKGSKKRYAGLLQTPNGHELYFSGMEYNRSDWTELAKNFQYELYQKIFTQADYESYIKDYVKKLREGHFNKLLVYKKKLTKRPEEYTKSIPPHVVAYRLRPRQQQYDKEVRYVMTRRGPIPIELPHDDIDFEHYIEKQVGPLADIILQTKNKSFQDIIGGGQLNLFSL